MFQNLLRPIVNKNGNLAEMAWLDWLTRDDQQQQADYVTYRKYYNGDHGLTSVLTDRQKLYLSLHDIDFRFNFLKLPIDVIVQRMNILGFEVEDKVLSNVLWQWWQLNDMHAKMKHIERQAQIDGDTYVLVEWDDEKKMPVIHHERAYDGEEGEKVHYAQEGRRVVRFASKRWRELDDSGKPHRRLNIYTADYIYKYIQDGSHDLGLGWKPYNPNDTEWPIPWPVGAVPIVHRRHQDNGTNWGLSELDDLIPPQQSLNKSVLDLLETSDNTPYQLVTIAGITLANESDKLVKPREALTSPDSATRFGYIPAGDILQLITLKNDFIRTIAQIAQIPMQYFQVTGQIASNDTQRADDSQVVAKAGDISIPASAFYIDVLKMCIRVSNEFGGTNYPIDAIITPKWDVFERIDKEEEDRTKAETARIKAETFDRLTDNGTNRETAALMAGYSEDEAAKLAVSTDFTRLPEIPNG